MKTLKLVLFLLVSPLATSSMVNATTMPSTQLSYESSNEVVWAGNAAYVVNQTRSYELKFIAQRIIEAYKANPQVDPIQLLDVSNEFIARFQNLKNGKSDLADSLQTVEQVYEILAKIPGASAVFGPLALAQSVAGQVYGKAIADDLGDMARYEYTEQVKSIQEIDDGVWRNLHVLGGSLPNAAILIDSLFGATLGASVLDDAAKILARNPEFDSNQLIRNALGVDGRLTVGLGDIKAAFEETTRDLRSLISASGRAIQDLDQQQKSLAQLILSQEREQVAREERAREARERRALEQAELAAKKSSLFIISTLAGFVDPEAGKVIHALGSATFRIADAISGHKNAVSSAGSGARAMEAFSSVVLTGNILSAGMQLLSVIGGGGPSLEQQIYEQVLGIRQDLQQLALNVEARFDRVDHSLNQIMTTMQQEFSQLGYDLQKVESELAIIRRSFYALQLQMNRMQSDLKDAIETGFKRTFLLDRKRCLEVQLYTRRTTMSFAQYADCLVTFADYAVNSSRDPIGRTELGGLDDESILVAVQERSVEKNFGLLAEIAEKRFGNFGMPERKDLVSPIEWAVGAEAYLKLVEARPENLKLTTPLALSEMIAAGNELVQTARGITTLRTSRGLQPSFAFLSALVNLYRKKAQAVLEVITLEKRKLESDPRNGTRGLDIWSPQQDLTFASPAVVPHCNPQADSRGIGLVGLPEGYLDSLSYADRALLHMGSEPLAVCYAFSTTRPQCKAMGTPFWSADCAATVTLTLFARIGNREVSRRTAIIDAKPLYTVLGDIAQQAGQNSFQNTPRYHSSIKDNWGDVRPWAYPADGRTKPALNLRANFMRLSREELSPSTLEQGAMEFSRELARQVRALKGRMLQQAYQQGAFQTALSELSGARKLLIQYLQIGLADSLERDDLVRGMVFGGDGIMDGDAVLKLLKDDKAGQWPALLSEQISERSLALERLLEEKVKSVNTEIEMHPLVSSTLRRLAAAREKQMESMPRESLETAWGVLQKRVSEMR